MMDEKPMVLSQNNQVCLVYYCINPKPMRYWLNMRHLQRMVRRVNQLHAVRVSTGSFDCALFGNFFISKKPVTSATMFSFMDLMVVVLSGLWQWSSFIADYTGFLRVNCEQLA